jgi:iron complex outermembrane receptor protein
MGLRLNGTWSSPVHVDGSGAPGSSTLRFGSVFNIDARLFVDLGQKKSLVRKVPFFKGARVSVRLDNILDSRQRVTDATGAVPIAYQADIVDPKGRSVGLDFRKLF